MLPLFKQAYGGIVNRACRGQLGYPRNGRYSNSKVNKFDHDNGYINGSGLAVKIKYDN
jgi:hypothetical protein